MLSSTAFSRSLFVFADCIEMTHPSLIWCTAVFDKVLPLQSSCSAPTCISKEMVSGRMCWCQHMTGLLQWELSGSSFASCCNWLPCHTNSFMKRDKMTYGNLVAFRASYKLRPPWSIWNIFTQRYQANIFSLKQKTIIKKYSHIYTALSVVLDFWNHGLWWMAMKTNWKSSTCDWGCNCDYDCDCDCGKKVWWFCLIFWNDLFAIHIDFGTDPPYSL